MKIVKPSYEVLTPLENKGVEIVKNIEKYARVCYKSEDKITDDSCFKFVKMLIDKGHTSTLEHEKITVRFICNRYVSHELVRHRLASFSQESTRYVDYGCALDLPQNLEVKTDQEDATPSGDFRKAPTDIEFIEPCFWDRDKSKTAYGMWLAHIKEEENMYHALREACERPERARYVLGNSLKTEIVVTANLREWRLIFKQRTAPDTNEQMRELMVPLLQELKEKIPVIFYDL